MAPLNLLFRYGLRSLWVRRATTVAAICGIALTVFVLAAALMLAAGLRETLLSAGQPDRALVLQGDAFAEGDSRVRQNAAQLVAAAPGVRHDAQGPLVSAETVVHVYLAQPNDENRLASVQIRGVTESAFRLRPEVTLVAGRKPREGTNEAMVGVGLRGQYNGLELGQGFALQKNRDVKVVGIFAAERSAYESEVWVDLDLVRSTFGWQGYLSAVSVRLESEQAFDRFAAAVTLDKVQGLSAERERAYYRKVSDNLSNTISVIGGLVASIFALGAMLGATITMYGAVSQRRREIGILRALGFARGRVLLALLVESGALALAGGALGLVLALCTQFLHFSTVNWATGQELVFRFLPAPRALGLALGVGCVAGVVGGFFPALKAARLSPTEAMRR